MAASIAFYRTLGLTQIVDAPHYARFACPEGGSSFSIHLVEGDFTPSQTVVYFEVESLDETVSSLVERGLTFEQLPQDQPWLWREARLRDPDGNQVCLYWAGANRLDPPWKLK